MTCMLIIVLVYVLFPDMCFIVFVAELRVKYSAENDR